MPDKKRKKEMRTVTRDLPGSVSFLEPSIEKMLELVGAVRAAERLGYTVEIRAVRQVPHLVTGNRPLHSIVASVTFTEAVDTKEG